MLNMKKIQLLYENFFKKIFFFYKIYFRPNKKIATAMDKNGECYF